VASLTRENSRPNEKVILPTWQMQGSVPRRLLDSSSTEDGTRGVWKTSKALPHLWSARSLFCKDATVII
jgi:hypothetical protein